LQHCCHLLLLLLLRVLLLYVDGLLYELLQLLLHGGHSYWRQEVQTAGTINQAGWLGRPVISL
jgi:hypothetical protein